jgi:hypothetical protein
MTDEQAYALARAVDALLGEEVSRASDSAGDGDQAGVIHLDRLRSELRDAFTPTVGVAQLHPGGFVTSDAAPLYERGAK